jgi:hypothetical protein
MRRAISALVRPFSRMAASTCRATTRLIAVAFTSSNSPSSRSQLSKVEPILPFVIILVPFDVRPPNWSLAAGPMLLQPLGLMHFGGLADESGHAVENVLGNSV